MKNCTYSSIPVSRLMFRIMNYNDIITVISVCSSYSCLPSGYFLDSQFSYINTVFSAKKLSKDEKTAD